MFVNAASSVRAAAGAVPERRALPLVDVWRAAAPSTDFLAPDIYFQNFAEWARRYKRSGNPLFVPEAMRSPEASVNGLYALGAHDAIGFSPFGIETISEPAAKHLAASYDLVAQLEPLLVERQGKGLSAGLMSEGPEQRQPQQVRLGDWILAATFERGTPPSLADGVIVPTGAPGGPPPPSGGLVLATGPDELIVAGNGDHDHVHGERPRQARGDPERRGGPLRRGALGEHPLAERRPDPPGAPRAARARALLDTESEALPPLEGDQPEVVPRLSEGGVDPVVLECTERRAGVEP
jgi:hypothetical protein